MNDENTEAQARVLRFLAAYPAWHTLTELDQLRVLQDDDVLCIPSLIERGLVDHQLALGAVRINPAGHVIAGEHSANG